MAGQVGGIDNDRARFLEGEDGFMHDVVDLVVEPEELAGNADPRAFEAVLLEESCVGGI
jgi:hypothetical protein